MITLQEFKSGELYYYSDMYDKSFCEIKAIAITKVAKNRPIFWFTAEITDNNYIENKEFHKMGSIHSFSNSFIYKTLPMLKSGEESYKDKQIDWLKTMARKQGLY